MSRGPGSNGDSRPPPIGAPADTSADAELGALLRQAATHVRALFEKGGEFASLGWRRLKLRSVDGLFTIAFVVAAATAGVTIVVVATPLAIAGLRHALAQWSGAEWVGELGSGLAALALPFIALAWLRHRSRRSSLDAALGSSRPGMAHAPPARKSDRGGAP